MFYIQEEIDRLKRLNEENYPLNARDKAKLEEFEHLLFLAEKERYDKQIDYTGSFLIEEIDCVGISLNKFKIIPTSKNGMTRSRVYISSPAGKLLGYFKVFDDETIEFHHNNALIDKNK